MTIEMAFFETTRESMAQFNACNHLIATDATIREVLLKKGELSLDEAEQLYSYVDMYCNAWATTHIAYDQGLVDRSIWAGVMQDIEVAMNRSGGFPWPSISIAGWQVTVRFGGRKGYPRRPLGILCLQQATGASMCRWMQIVIWRLHVLDGRRSRRGR